MTEATWNEVKRPNEKSFTDWWSRKVVDENRNWVLIFCVIAGIAMSTGSTIIVASPSTKLFEESLDGSAGVKIIFWFGLMSTFMFNIFAIMNMYRMSFEKNSFQINSWLDYQEISNLAEDSVASKHLLKLFAAHEDSAWRKHLAPLSLILNIVVTSTGLFRITQTHSFETWYDWEPLVYMILFSIISLVILIVVIYKLISEHREFKRLSEELEKINR